LKPGDYLFIPAHTRHHVAWTDGKEKTVWLAIHIKSETIGKAGKAGVGTMDEGRERR
jgi:quercetin dioxygenase-like cupin family protein